VHYNVFNIKCLDEATLEQHKKLAARLNRRFTLEARQVERDLILRRRHSIQRKQFDRGLAGG
jgi:hypothetical protein